MAEKKREEGTEQGGRLRAYGGRERWMGEARNGGRGGGLRGREKGRRGKRW